METNGKIRIRPIFDNSVAKKGAKELEEMLERVKKKTMDSFASIPNKGFAFTAKSAQRELNKIDSALEKAQTKLQEYQNKLDEIDAKKDVELNKIQSSPEVKNTWALKGDSEADALVEKKMAESKAVQKLNDEYDKTLEKVEMMKEKIAALNQKHIDESKNKVSDLKKKVDDTASSIKKAKSNQDNFTSSISKGIKKMAKMALAIFSIRGAYSLVRQAVNNVISSNDELSGKIESCKNMLGAVFEPMVATIVNGIVKAISYLGTFISMLTGINLIAKANAKALDKQAGSASKAAKSLLAIDEINNLNENSAGSDSGSSTALLEEADDMKAKFEELLEPIRNAWDKYGQEFIDKFKYGLSEVKGLIGAIGFSFKEVWLNGTGEKTVSLILEGFTAIFGIIGNISKKLKEAWNENKIGTSIVQHLWNAFNNLLEIVILVFETIEELTEGIDFSPILQGIDKLADVFDRVTEYARNFAKELLDALKTGDLSEVISVLANSISDIIIKICGTITELIKSVDWFGLGADVANWIFEGIILIIELLTSIDWEGLFISVGEMMVTGLGAGLEFLVMTVVEIFRKMVQAVKDFLGIHSPSKLFEEIGLNIFKGIENGLSGLVQWFENLFRSAYDRVKDVFKDIEIWVETSIVNPVKTAIEKFINDLISGFEGFVNYAIRGVNAIIDALNSIHFDIPSWVPIIGGKSYGISIGRLSEISLPRVKLAQGGIVNRPTRALVGEAGAEAVLPLQNSNFIDDFADKISSKIGMSGSTDLDGVIQLLLDIADILTQILNKDNDVLIDGDSLAEVIQKKTDDRQKRMGTKALALDR